MWKRSLVAPPGAVSCLAARLPLALSFFTPNAAGGVVEPAEEERCVGDIAQNLRPAVEVCLEVLLGDGVAPHRAQREDVLPHEPQVLAGLTEVVAFGGENGVRGRRLLRAAGRAWRALRLSRWARACVITSMGSGAGTRAEKFTRAYAKPHLVFPRPRPRPNPQPPAVAAVPMIMGKMLPWPQQPHDHQDGLRGYVSARGDHVLAEAEVGEGYGAAGAGDVVHVDARSRGRHAA